MTRVLVTGLGVVSPIGIGTDRFWSALCYKRSNFGAMDAVYPGMKPGFLAGRLSSEDRSSVMDRARRPCSGTVPDASLFAIDAALQALAAAGLAPGDRALRSALVCVGNNEAEADLLDELVEGRRERWDTHTYSSHAVAFNVADAIGSNGPVLTVHNTCASGNVALEIALRLFRRGQITTAVVGGGDAFSKKVWSGFYLLNALGPERCRPFSAKRRFITISEGAAFMVLQADDLVACSSEPYAELLAVVSNNDAKHPTNPDHAGVRRCHDRLLEQAGLVAPQVDAIFAHGTGTRANDMVEGRICSEHYPHAAVTAIKGTVGHLMATAGAIGSVASCLALRHQLIPPTNIDPDECEYPIDLITATGGEPRSLRYVQSNAFGFGGNNAIALFRSIGMA